MSHELRTPLTGVIGFSDLLGKQFYGKLNEKQLGYVGEISEAGHNLLTLINDILDLAKVESGKMDIKVSNIFMNELLEHCLLMIRQTAVKRGLKLDLRVSEDLSEEIIQADYVRLKQIIMNLLSNAVKFTPSGGTIRLEAERQEQAIQVSVCDTGIGVKPEDQERIFDAFERLDSSFARQEPGTGLGLALVRKLVELQGGRIWIESKGERMGSTFRFTFPLFLAETDIEARHPPEFVSSPSLPQPYLPGQENNRPKVLVVEDNESNMKLITDLLEATFYEVIRASSAEEAIKTAETEKPVLILMDLSLPGMDGLNATKVLKRKTATAHIPVMALTAHAMKKDKERAIEAGCDACIFKPIDTKTFYQTLEDLVATP